jgi:hypothetical protein
MKFAQNLKKRKSEKLLQAGSIIQKDYGVSQAVRRKKWKIFRFVSITTGTGGITGPILRRSIDFPSFEVHRMVQAAALTRRF